MMEYFRSTGPALLLWLLLMTQANAAVDSRESNTWTRGRLFDRVVIVVLENQDYDEAIQDPYFKNLMQQGTVFTHFTAVRHPSYPNYLAMVGGSTFGVQSDSQTTIQDQSVVDLLETHHLTWKGYADAYPGNCYLKSKKGTFARKHVPLLSFKSIQQDPGRCNRIVPGEEFQNDWKSHKLPNYSFYSPDLDEDGHDTDLPTASGWLENFLKPVLSDTQGMDRTLIVVTFDESETLVGSNQVFTLFLGSMVKPGGTVVTSNNHYNVLKTIEENFALGSLEKEDKTANPILDAWVN